MGTETTAEQITDSGESVATASLVSLSDAAREVVLAAQAGEASDNELALQIEVVGAGATDYLYELTFAPAGDAGPGDSLGYSATLAVLVPAASVDKLRGSSLDHIEPTGLVLRNPNRPRPSSPTTGPTEPVHLEGSVAERLQQLLDGEINPMLAAHGGFAAVDRVEGEIAYMIMGGGCQGCGLAQLTLTEGIKATVEDRIPEISEVVDVTDHAAGDNPYYQPDSK